MFDGAHLRTAAPRQMEEPPEFGKLRGASDVLLVGTATDHGERREAELRSAGLCVTRAVSVDAPRLAGRLASFDLILIEPLRGGQADLAACHRIAAVAAAPVVALADLPDESDRILSLELGADDWIASGAEEREFMARVRALVRRRSRYLRERRATSVVRFDNWALSRDRRELSREGGAGVLLTSTEYNVLSILLENPGRAVSRQELVAGSPRGAHHSGVGVTIFRLRQKLGIDGDGARIIRSVRSVGYMLDAVISAC